ncbi:MAG: preprotein translocase subunit YajC [Clostridiales Family XIII bacterium]|jgi:preprotein translocase YajC subunit|nr:preprotein translocase subunit YajC [Clostridiales Family XIII bacterium]
MSSQAIQIGGLVLIFFVMYMILIRPQRKRDKAVAEMRNKLKVGDKITTIGGIKGTIVRVNDQTIVIQVGADKVKLELMRWSVSTLDEEGPTSRFRDEEDEEEKEEKKASKRPKKLGKSEDAGAGADTEKKDEPAEAEEPAAEEVAEEAAEETAAEESADTEAKDDASEEKAE